MNFNIVTWVVDRITDIVKTFIPKADDRLKFKKEMAIFAGELQMKLAVIRHDILTFKTGIKWVDAIRGLMLPMITCVVMYNYLSYKQGWSTISWDEFDIWLTLGVVSFQILAPIPGAIDMIKNVLNRIGKNKK